MWMGRAAACTRTGQVINKDDMSLYAPCVQAVNDRLSREMGF